MEGKLLRPLFAFALVPPEARTHLDERFWSGALAIQMVHEASLVHDDVIDGAEVRRGRPTVLAEKGVAAAVVLGDHYLTGAYRAAAATGSFEFLGRFTQAVERTVAGEIAQGRAAGVRASPEEYDRAITGKSGELFGIAGALVSTVTGLGQADERYELGRTFGNFYQRIDDLLDYCHLARTGKPPLQDYRHGKWSWILDLAGVDGFGLEEEAVADAVFRRSSLGPSAARRAVELLHDRKRAFLRGAARLGTVTEELQGLLALSVGTAECHVREQEKRMGLPARHARAGRAGSVDGATSPNAPRATSREAEEAFVLRRAGALGGPKEWRRYFGEHARTFRLATRLFPPREAGLVTGLYAYCRFTDDLVDDPADAPSPEVLARRLDVWRELTLAAYDGTVTGIPILDTVVATAAARGVDRDYPEALLDGVGMDVAPRRYRSWDELERYTFCVAGAVGGWMTQLFEIDDPELVERAHALGHAMQLTNIARDVGEDWRNGRIYLPVELLRAHRVSPEDMGAMIDGTLAITESYRSAIREVLTRADDYYEQAWPGIRALPSSFRRPVAAAAAAYRGIHREIRRNGYDNLTERAHTSLTRKVLLAGAGLVAARSPVS